MRRWIAGAAAGLGLLLAAPIAQGQDSVPAEWAGSRITTPTVVDTDHPVLSAVFVRAWNKSVPGWKFVPTGWFTTPTGLPPECGAPGERPVTMGPLTETGEPNAWSTSAVVDAPCNGTYTFKITATLTRPLTPTSSLTLNGRVTVNAPPPEVKNVKAALEGTSVVLTWNAVSDPPPDFSGYRVERQEPSGKYTTIAGLGKSATTFTDASPPPEGGEVVYRVVALREGTNGAVSSDGGRSNPVNLPVPSSTTVPGATDAGTTDGGTEGTAGTAGTGDGTTEGGTAGETTGGTTRATPRFTTRAQTGVGTRAPRLGIDSGSRSGLLLEPVDEGFDEEIDYGQLPGDDESLGDDLLVFDETSGRGLAVPIGIGAVLMGWGLHLFFLARAARPAMMTVPVDDYDAYDPVVDDVGYIDPDPGYGGTSYGSSYGSSYGGSSSTYGTRYPSYDTYDSYDPYDDYDG